MKIMIAGTTEQAGRGTAATFDRGDRETLVAVGKRDSRQ